MILFQSKSRPSAVIFLLSIVICFIPGIFSVGVVTLESIEIDKTHEWLNGKPTVYFHCQGENKTILPDVKKTHFLYTFNGEESWQPLTEIADKKCKRCGFYEKDTIKTDDIFDVWEFCLSDFNPPDGKYSYSKENEFRATFACPRCFHLEGGSTQASKRNGGDKEKRTKVALVIIISFLLLLVSILGAVAAYRYWQKKKREQDQARFLKLFEDGEDIEDEFDLDHVI